MLLHLSILHRIVVAIHHCRIGIRSHAKQSFQGRQTDSERCGFGEQQGIVGIHILGNAHHRVTTRE